MAILLSLVVCSLDHSQTDVEPKINTSVQIDFLLGKFCAAALGNAL
jgi:hypothetical protein